MEKSDESKTTLWLGDKTGTRTQIFGLPVHRGTCIFNQPKRPVQAHIFPSPAPALVGFLPYPSHFLAIPPSCLSLLPSPPSLLHAHHLGMSASVTRLLPGYPKQYFHLTGKA